MTSPTTANGAKRSQIEELAGLGLIKRNENVVLVGSRRGQDPSGHGVGLQGDAGWH